MAVEISLRLAWVQTQACDWVCSCTNPGLSLGVLLHKKPLEAQMPARFSFNSSPFQWFSYWKGNNSAGLVFVLFCILMCRLSHLFSSTVIFFSLCSINVFMTWLKGFSDLCPKQVSRVRPGYTPALPFYRVFSCQSVVWERKRQVKKAGCGEAELVLAVCFHLLQEEVSIDDEAGIYI